MKFDNKDYKLIKKENNKILAALNLEKTKLDTKHEEISERKIVIQNQIDQISNNDKNINIINANTALTKNEKNFPKYNYFFFFSTEIYLLSRMSFWIF